MAFKCINESPCFDPENPFQNLSSEDNDGPVFIVLSPGNWFTPPPPLGSNFRNTSVGGVTTRPQTNPDGTRNTVGTTTIDAHNTEIETLVSQWGTPPGTPQPDNPDGTPPGTPPVTPPNPFGTPQGVDGVPPAVPPNVPPIVPQVFPSAHFNTPQSVTVTCPDGLPFTISIPAGIIEGLSQAEANAAVISYIEQNIVSFRFCLSDAIFTGCVGNHLSRTITVSGGVPPFDFTADSLPPGLELIPTGDTTCEIVGTPTAAGSQNFVVRATDLFGNFMEKVYPSHFIAFAQSSLPDGVFQQAYNSTLTGLGTVFPAFEIIAGALPAGLGLSITGTISGAPIDIGTFFFTVKMTDQDNSTCEKLYSITVTNPATPCLTNSGTLTRAQIGIPYSVTLTPATPPDAGMQYQFTIASGGLPAGLVLHGTTGVIDGTPTGNPATASFCIQVDQIPL